MKKLTKLLLTIFFLLLITTCCSCSSKVSSKKAAKNNDERILSIIDETGQVINEIHVYYGKGTEIEEALQINPDSQNIRIPISHDYDEKDEFTVVLIDRYGVKYRKSCKGVPNDETTEIIITEKDKLEDSEDSFTKLSKFFNGD